MRQHNLLARRFASFSLFFFGTAQTGAESFNHLQPEFCFDTANQRFSGRAEFFQRFKLAATNRLSKLKI